MAKYISAGKVALSTTISQIAYNKLAAKRASSGTPIGEYIDQLILDDNEVYSDVLDAQIKSLSFIELNLKRKKEQVMRFYRRVKNLPKTHEDYVTIESRKSLWSDSDEAMLEAISNALKSLIISFSKMNEIEKRLDKEFAALINPEEKYKY